MTRTHDTLAVLRSLDVADRKVDSQRPRVRADLARILSSELTQIPDHPPARGGRGGRGGRRWKVAAAGGVVAAVTATVVLMPSVTGGDRAFATWTPRPDALSAAARAEAAASCREAQGSASTAADARELAAAAAVVAERRGVWTMVVLANSTGFAAMCVTDQSAGLFADDMIGSVGTPSGDTAPGPRELIATDLGSGTLEAGELSLAAGSAGPDVAVVAYRSRDHGIVEATVSEGHFAFWFPGDELETSRDGVVVDVTYLDGTRGTLTLRL